MTASPFQIGDTVTLSSTDSHHICDVLRLPLSATLSIVCASSGQEFEAKICALKPAVQAKLEQISKSTPISMRGDTLVVPLLKGDHLELAIEKATELGASTISVYQAARSVVTVEESSAPKKLLRWNRVAEAAAKQSARSTLPTLNFFASLDAAIAGHDSGFFGSLNPSARPLRSFKWHAPCALVTGPEGDFSPQEEALLLNQGFRPVSLGSLVLRAETAAIVILSSANAIWGDFSEHEMP